MTEIPYKEVLLWFMGFVSSVLIIRLQFQNERLKAAENQLSEKKYKVYADIISVFFEIMEHTKKDIPTNSDEYMQRILAIKKEVFIYGTDEIFFKLSDWLVSSSEGLDNLKGTKRFVELLILIRKDMGNKKTQVQIDDFMIFTMQDRKEYLKFKNQANW